MRTLPTLCNLSAILVLLGQLSWCGAQQVVGVPLVALQPANQLEKAVIAIDINPVQLKDHPVVQMSFKGAPTELKNLLNAQRISGTMTLPNDPEEFANISPFAEVPFEFFLIIEFANKADRLKVLPEEALESLERVKLQGKNYYSGPSEQLNILLMVEDHKIEVGTRNYLLADNRDFATPDLKEAMRAMPPSPARVAVDLQGARNFFDAAILLAKQQQPPAFVAPFIDLPKKIDSASLTVDLKNDLMARLTTNSGSEMEAQSVGKAFKAILDLIKFSANSSPTPDAKFAVMLLAATAVETENDTTQLSLKKPENFEGNFQELIVKGAANASRANSLKQVLLAMHNFESAYNRLPFKMDENPNFSADLSWRVRVLPFVEQQPLYQQFKANEAWDSETNKALMETTPAIYGQNGRSQIVWIESEVTGFREILDGTSNTIAMIEIPDGVEWTKPADISAEDAVKLIKGLKDDASILVGFYDGSVVTITNKTSEDALRAMMTPSGGEVVDRRALR
jgi:Protein of unknown function (DUF1559)